MRILILLLLCSLAGVRAATAQALEGCGPRWEQLSAGFVRMGEGDEAHYRRTGDVEVTCSDMKFFADEMDLYLGKHLLVARGNVVFTSGANRIGADRMEFDTKTRTGTFYNAAGSATLGDRVDRSLFGTQEPDAYFYGEKIEKLGPRKYRVTRGGFTTCVQPTPRWEMTSGTATFTLDQYVFLRNAVLRVKGVPLLYLPAFYYPIQEDDRATGFLIPTYGGSSYRGQTLSNAFFWAIGRSHDATFFHDWFSKTGQGAGAEYRYVLSGESAGNMRTYLLDEHEAVINGQPTQPRRNYTVTGSLTQRLPVGLRARAQADYYTDLGVQQLYQQSVYHATSRRRSYGGNVTGSWGPYVIGAAFDRAEVFNNAAGTDSNVYGSAPRITFSRSERPLGATPVYVSVNGDYAALVRRNKSPTLVVDQGLQRLDVTPLIRIPFTRWPFLTINSSAAWRNTWWTESLDPITHAQIDAGISRRYVDLQSSITGPVFNRIFNTPGGGYAEKFKHVIEPSVTFQRTTEIDVFDRLVKLDGVEYVPGNVTRIAYGLTNRLYAKRREGGAQAIPHEIASLTLAQSYYTDAAAAQYDLNYQTGFTGARRSPFSPLAAVLRVSPVTELTGELRAEYDTRFKALRTINASGSWRRPRIDTTVNWSQYRFIDEQTGIVDPNRRDHVVRAATTLRTDRNRFGGTYSFNLDLFRNTLIEQRIVGYYNAQCCGIAVEYQTFNFGRFGSTVGVPQDRRFNISFTLAGIGTFSNPLGAFGVGDQIRR